MSWPASFGGEVVSTRRATPHCLVLICNRFASGNAASCFVAEPRHCQVHSASLSLRTSCGFAAGIARRGALAAGLLDRVQHACVWSTSLAPFEKVVADWPGMVRFVGLPGELLLALAGTCPVQRPCLSGTKCKTLVQSWRELVRQTYRRACSLRPHYWSLAVVRALSAPVA